MAESLKKKLHIRRNFHRDDLSRLITEFSRTDQEDLLNLKELGKSLEEKMKILKNLHDEKLELIPEDEAETLSNEIDKSRQFLDEINDILVKIKSVFSKNSSLSDIEKFNYLRFHLTETTGECIKGLSLISANYQKAVEILKERYENKQIFISSYMDVLVKLPKVDNMKDIDKLCKI